MKNLEKKPTSTVKCVETHILKFGYIVVNPKVTNYKVFNYFEQNSKSYVKEFLTNGLLKISLKTV